MAEKLRKRRKEVALRQKEKKEGPIVITPGLSVSNYSVLNDNVKFISIFMF